MENVKFKFNTEAKFSLSAQLFTKFKSYIPFTSSSLDFESLNIIINDLIINNRTSIVELGSGFSTILVAKVIKLNSHKCKFVSIEHDSNWANIIRELLIKEELEGIVDVINAPLVDSYYDLTELYTQVNYIDSLIIDGPPAYKKEIELSRLPALYRINKLLLQNFFIFLHDTNRPGEKQVLKKWANDFGLKFLTLSKGSYTLKGNYYNID